jgi:hypothetical protein
MVRERVETRVCNLLSARTFYIAVCLLRCYFQDRKLANSDSISLSGYSGRQGIQGPSGPAFSAAERDAIRKAIGVGSHASSCPFLVLGL